MKEMLTQQNFDEPEWQQQDRAEAGFRTLAAVYKANSQ